MGAMAWHAQPDEARKQQMNTVMSCRAPFPPALPFASLSGVWAAFTQLTTNHSQLCSLLVPEIWEQMEGVLEVVPYQEPRGKAMRRGIEKLPGLSP